MKPERKNPRGIARHVAAFFMLALTVSGFQPSFGQTSSDASAATSAFSPVPSPIPFSYDPALAKKPSAAKRPDAVRAIVIAFGSLPFTAFYTDFVFDSVRFAVNNFDLQYAPWPFKNQYSAAIGVPERFTRLGVALGISAVVGLLDLILPH